MAFSPNGKAKSQYAELFWWTIGVPGFMSLLMFVRIVFVAISNR